MDFIPGGELSRRIREGDVSAESELIRQFEPGLRVLLRRRTGGDHGLLQDLVQETLLIVIQRLRGAGIDDPQKLAAFAAQTARNLAIASLRKTERQRTDVDSAATDRNADPSRGVEEIAADVESALAVRALLREHDGDLTAFYAAVRKLAEMPKEARTAALEARGERGG